MSKRKARIESNVLTVMAWGEKAGAHNGLPVGRQAVADATGLSVAEVSEVAAYLKGPGSALGYMVTFKRGRSPFVVIAQHTVPKLTEGAEHVRKVGESSVEENTLRLVRSAMQLFVNYDLTSGSARRERTRMRTTMTAYRAMLVSAATIWPQTHPVRIQVERAIATCPI